MKKTIALLYGGISSERDISIMSASSVRKALIRLGYNVLEIDIKYDFMHQIKQKKFDLAFIAIHGKHGEDGCIQGFLELMNIPYTHSGVLASSVCMNKMVAKSIFAQLGIDTADGRIIKKEEILSKNVLYNKKYVLKPIDQGSSINVHIVDNKHEFTLKNYPFFQDPMLEEFIPGQEIHVGIVAGKAIGATEIIPTKKNFYDYETKYTQGAATHICPAPLQKKTYDKALKQAQSVYNFLGCKGIGRADFRYDQNADRLVMLEFNTHPGFTELSLVPEIAAKCTGMSFDQLVQAIIDDA